MRRGGLAAQLDQSGQTRIWPDNRIVSSKYTPLTFLPVMLFEQLLRPANFYFVCIAILQVIPVITTSGGRPTILVPLIFVLAVSGVKEALEDYV